MKRIEEQQYNNYLSTIGSYNLELEVIKPIYNYNVKQAEKHLSLLEGKEDTYITNYKNLLKDNVFIIKNKEIDGNSVYALLKESNDPKNALFFKTALVNTHILHKNDFGFGYAMIAEKKDNDLPAYVFIETELGLTCYILD